MSSILGIFMTILCLGGLNADAVTETAGITSENVNYIGFDGHDDYEIINGILSDQEGLPVTYYVVSRDIIHKKILPVFVKRFRNMMQQPRLPEHEIRDYWSNIFSAPVYIFVFSRSDGTEPDAGDAFSRSASCCEMVVKSLEYKRGFFWMGTMSIIEEQVKQCLQVPDQERLIATICFGHRDQNPYPHVLTMQ